MSKLLVLPYKTASKSAETVSGILGCLRMKVEGSSIRDLATTTIVNWGNSTTDLSQLPSVKVFNKPANVRTASHKLDFKAISAENEGASLPVCIPDWTTSVAEARRWYSDGHDVVCRHTLQGHSGDGLELVKYDDDVIASRAVPKAPLYTKYVKKRDEYRVHVVQGVATFVQRKARERGSESLVNYQIRNHSNGFIFVTQDLNPHKSVIAEAVNAVNALGLDFGAVDVIWNERRKVATVIEVNTACGLTSPLSIQRYTHALKVMVTGVGSQVSWKDELEGDTSHLSLGEITSYTFREDIAIPGSVTHSNDIPISDDVAGSNGITISDGVTASSGITLSDGLFFGTNANVVNTNSARVNSSVGQQIFRQNYRPASGNAGDVWFDTTNGGQVSHVFSRDGEWVRAVGGVSTTSPSAQQAQAALTQLALDLYNVSQEEDDDYTEDYANGDIVGISEDLEDALLRYVDGGGTNSYIRNFIFHLRSHAVAELWVNNIEEEESIGSLYYSLEPMATRNQRSSYHLMDGVPLTGLYQEEDNA